MQGDLLRRDRSTTTWLARPSRLKQQVGGAGHAKEAAEDGAALRRRGEGRVRRRAEGCERQGEARAVDTGSSKSRALGIFYLIFYYLFSFFLSFFPAASRTHTHVRAACACAVQHDPAVRLMAHAGPILPPLNVVRTCYCRTTPPLPPTSPAAHPGRNPIRPKCRGRRSC